MELTRQVEIVYCGDCAIIWNDGSVISVFLETYSVLVPHSEQVIRSLKDLQSELRVQLRIGLQKLGQECVSLLGGIHADRSVEPSFREKNVTGLLDLFDEFQAEGKRLDRGFLSQGMVDVVAGRQHPA